MNSAPDPSGTDEPPTPSEPWLPLISRLFDEELSPAEWERLGRWLETEAAAREALVAASELHAMLESEPSVRVALAMERLPENVVAIEGASASGGPAVAARAAKALRAAGSAGPALSSGRGGRKGGTAFPWRPLLGLSGLAATVIAAVVLLPEAVERAVSQAQPGGPIAAEAAQRGGGPAEIHAAEPADRSLRLAEAPAESGEHVLRPEEQYERAALAVLGSGSETRPATNFSAEPSAAAEELSFNRHIRPILSENCFACHGPDEAHRSAGLRLDTREGATEGDHPAILPGDPGGSELMARVRSEDPDDIMPPPTPTKR